MNNKVGGDFITFQYRYRKQIIMAISILLIIGVGIGLLFYYQEKDVVEEESIKQEIMKENQEENIYLSVDIKGEINSPGIYTMKESSRVIDVIDKAGGLTENADTSVINLSKKIMDEMVIIIYSKEQVKNFEETKEKEKNLQEKCISADINSLQNDACITTTQNNASGKVNINQASKEELMTLTGIGESKAKDIISYREKNGPFTSIEDIKKVSGIGETIYAQIKEAITV